jgi:hypothetical protein
MERSVVFDVVATDRYSSVNNDVSSSGPKFTVPGCCHNKTNIRSRRIQADATEYREHFVYTLPVDYASILGWQLQFLIGNFFVFELLLLPQSLVPSQGYSTRMSRTKVGAASALVLPLELMLTTSHKALCSDLPPAKDPILTCILLSPLVQVVERCLMCWLYVPDL